MDGISSTLDSLPVLFGGVGEVLHSYLSVRTIRPREDFQLEPISGDLFGNTGDGHESLVMPFEFLDPDGNLGRRGKALAEEYVFFPGTAVTIAGVQHAGFKMEIVW